MQRANSGDSAEGVWVRAGSAEVTRAAQRRGLINFMGVNNSEFEGEPSSGSRGTGFAGPLAAPTWG